MLSLFLATGAVTAQMKLANHVGAEKALVYTTLADFSDGAPTAETILIRFQTEESSVWSCNPLTCTQKTRTSHSLACCLFYPLSRV